MTPLGSWLLGLGAALALMLGAWLLSLIRRDASVVDIFWGFGFAVLAWLYALTGPALGPRAILVTGMVTVWGLRLSVHLLLRNRRQGEDRRYAAMRERWGERFPAASLFTIFLLQGFLLWFIALPVHRAARAPEPAALAALDFAGTALFAIGLLFEAIGDAQLARFKADPANRDQVMDRGLWRWTRHPNYFGDALVWWGIFLVAAATPGGWRTVASPLLMTILLVNVSGVPLLEKDIAERRPGYRDYVRRTSAFLPWFPRPDRRRR